MNIDILAVRAVKERNTALLVNLLRHYDNAEHLLFLAAGDDATFDAVMQYSNPSDDTIRAIYNKMNLHSIRRLIPLVRTRCYIDEAVIAAASLVDPEMSGLLSSSYVDAYKLMRDKGLMTLNDTNFFVAASIFRGMKLVQSDKAVRALNDPGPLIKYVFPATPSFATTCSRYRNVFFPDDNVTDRKIAVLSDNVRFFEETPPTIDDVAMAVLIDSTKLADCFWKNKKTKKWAKMLKNIDVGISREMVDAIERCGFRFLARRLR
jgi:hypothetical protein